MAANRSEIRVSNLRRQDRSDIQDLSKTTAAERLQMMWQLTLDAWAANGEPVTDQKLPLHVVKVRRPINRGLDR